eukprot:TRINITY_DN2786_c0_g1_i2.p1 TRINITY_DN2786_c0_g1~~TRINITY_DN2786_c0_g1_i2.p1  ORF type:complete len:131 (+),score=9.53 TRINITY_DN2786_c0_g1_i2:55-393(+)
MKSPFTMSFDDLYWTGLTILFFGFVFYKLFTLKNRRPKLKKIYDLETYSPITPEEDVEWKSEVKMYVFRGERWRERANGQYLICNNRYTKRRRVVMHQAGTGVLIANHTVPF